ncbi:MAG: hypothetical protein RLZZ399_2076, partial [Verrucomicrobiota bacterium]
MANILLVDSDEIAQRAMLGILSRDHHRCVPLSSAADAWEFIRQNIKVDLVIMELRLKGENGIALITRLKSDRILKNLPVVVYTAPGDRESVRRALALRVQNVLLKPYQDELIFAEINRALEQTWYLPHFENPEVFCQARGQTPEWLRVKRDELRKTLELGRVSLIERLDSQDINQIMDEHKIVTVRMDSEGMEAVLNDLSELEEKAKEVGFTGAVHVLDQLTDQARSSKWTEFRHNLYNLDLCSHLTYQYLSPDLIPEGFLQLEEVASETDVRERQRWAAAAEKKEFPVFSWPELQRELESLNGCPVVESAAAAFHMTANGKPTSMTPLMDLVDKDPGLAAQVLLSLVKLRRSKGRDTGASVEETSTAITMLGESNLSNMGYKLLTTKERCMLIPPVSSWSQYWMFQLGTARLADRIAQYMELNRLVGVAYTAGLLHDIGKLLLVRLHPLAYQKILTYAREHKVPLSTAEKLHLETTTPQMAAY